MNAISRLKRMLSTAALGLAAVMILPDTAMAAAPPVVSTTSSPLTSNNGVIPDSDGARARYLYDITDGGSVTDNIQVQICLTGQNDEVPWTSFQTKIGLDGGGLPGVTLPSNLTFTSPVTPTFCQSAQIQIATGALNLTDSAIPQEFGVNLRVADENASPGNLRVNWTGIRVIQIRVQVRPAVSNASCFITDSSGSLLTKCDGTLADKSGSDEGRFAIVANKKNLETATNPGQFYYNLLYHNPGSDSMTVDVAFGRNGVSPKGTQAIHAALFAPPFSGYTQEGFDTVNESIPEGADDQVLGITIPAGWTLWVDYHLEWNGLGSLVPAGCATNCDAANQAFSVTGTVTPSSGSPEACTSGALGYKK